MLLFVAAVVPSPPTSFQIFCLAAFLAAFPTLFGKGRPRLYGAIICIFSIWLAGAQFENSERFMEQYKQTLEKQAQP